MLNQSPPKPNFRPLFCTAHHLVTDKVQYLAQLQPPFQFVAIVSYNFTATDNPYLYLHLYPKPGWPTRYPKVLSKMKVSLLSVLDGFFLDLPQNLNADVIETDKTIDDLPPSTDFMFCEASDQGLPFDTVLFIQRPWTLFAPTSEEKLRLIYSDKPQYSEITPGELTKDFFMRTITTTDAENFLNIFQTELDRVTPDDFV